ncbi:MAG: hypothetical protein GVY17_11910 [Cyanobacteria bacterium]|jgi:hypothetical protein|nr:hypothetical protein [Cyanobacteria bacterium GSL.Bin21]
MQIPPIKAFIKILVKALLFAGIVSEASAQIFNYYADYTPYFSFELSGPLVSQASFYDQRAKFDEKSGNFVVELNTQALTMTFTEMNIAIGSGSYSATKEVTTGFNETRTITANILFDPISIQLYDLDTLNLTPAVDGDFSYGENFGIGSGNYVGNFIINISGSYEMTDGLDERSGIFDYALQLNSYTTNGMLVTDGFPEEIVIGRSGVSPWRTTYYSNGDSTLISETYGTTDVHFDVSNLSVGTANIMTMVQVPEPKLTTLVFVLMALSLVVFNRTKSKRKP